MLGKSKKKVDAQKRELGIHLPQGTILRGQMLSLLVPSELKVLGSHITPVVIYIYEWTSTLEVKTNSLRQVSIRIDHIPTQQLLRPHSIHQLLYIAGLATVGWGMLSHKRIPELQQC